MEVAPSSRKKSPAERHSSVVPPGKYQQRPEFSKRTAFVWTGVLFIAFALGYPIVSELFPKGHVSEVVKHLLLVLAAVTGAHILERTILWKAMTEEVRGALTRVLQDRDALVKSASACGITSMWPARRLNAELVDTDDLVREIEDTVRGARERVWLLGVALAEGLNLGRLLDDLVRIKTDRERQGESFDVRILLLDPLRGSALFRNILENSPGNVKDFVSAEGVQRGAYFDTLLYVRFKMAFVNIKCYEALNDRVKFYGRDPLCWLAIVDGVAYFEPYTFGRPRGHIPPNLCLGAQMPVFKFSRQPRSHAFEILESHFKTLWDTSDTGVAEEERRQERRAELLDELLNHRNQWLDFLHRTFLIAADSFEPSLKPDETRERASAAECGQ